MKKVRVKMQTDCNEFKPSLKNFSKYENIRIMEKELGYYRHRCEDSWFKSLLDELKLEKRKITPARMRKIIVGAIRKRMETGGRGY